MSFGRSYKNKDPRVDIELGRLFAKFEAHIRSENLDMAEVCQAVGREMRDGQLGVLNRVTTGETAVSGLVFNALTEAPGSPVAGLLVLADRTTWDPLGKGSGGAYFAWYNGSAWRAPDAQ